MSRIGKRVIVVPQGVKVDLKTDLCTVEGPKGKLQHSIPHGIKLQVESGKITVTPEHVSRELNVLHGTTRAILANMVTGVSQGFQKGLEISGVGYKAEVQGSEIVFTLGFNHPVKIPIPPGIQVKVEKQTSVSISGSDRQTVGQLASVLRRLRPADPYKEKGIKYAGEVIRRKAGKATVAKAA